MHISRETLKEFVAPPIPMTLWGSSVFVNRYFCGPMTVQGYCSSICENCKLALQKAFTLHNVIGRPEGLLIWKLRDAVAVQQEVTQKEKKVFVSVDRFGVEVEENSFDALLKALSE
jgi:hypothetical protein